MNINKILAIIFFAAMACAVTGCNTMAGLGEDIQKAGESIEGAAK
jgi:predicted small secreted protein